jgi:hypothetical protein
MTLLGLGLGALLAAAVLGSRALLNAPIDLPPPPPMPQVAVPVHAPTPIVREYVAPAAQPTPVAIAPPPVQPPPVQPPPPPVAVAEPPAVPQPDDENPFLNENSAEIDYAYALVYGAVSTPDSARIAAEVFERCIKQAPENHRCQRGLVAAQERQQPGWQPPPEMRPIAPLNQPPRSYGRKVRQQLSPPPVEVE